MPLCLLMGARSLKKKERSSVDGLSVNSTDIMDAVAAVSLKVTPSQRNKLDPAKPLFLKSLKASQGFWLLSCCYVCDN